VVFRDNNGNGVYDRGDTAVPNARLVILLPDGRQVTVTTDARGIYTLPSDVPEGEYTVLINVPGEEGPPRIGNIIVRSVNLQLDIPIISTTLPVTGAATTTQVGWAVSLLILGLFCLALARRRRDDSERLPSQ
jgi:SdrD B-like domain